MRGGKEKDIINVEENKNEEDEKNKIEKVSKINDSSNSNNIDNIEKINTSNNMHNNNNNNNNNIIENKNNEKKEQKNEKEEAEEESDETNAKKKNKNENNEEIENLQKNEENCETEENNWSSITNANIPFIGNYISLDNLEKEYENNTNFINKIKNIKDVFIGMRNVKGDGCCFYRALLFRIFEFFLKKKNEIQNFIDLISTLKNQFKEAGYTYSTIDEFYEEFVDNLRRIENLDATIETVEQIFNNSITSNYLVVYARLLVSCHMKLNEEMYRPYITNYISIEEFCKNEVDPMYVEAEHLQVNALTNALNFPIEIIYLDNTKQLLPSRHRFPEGSEPFIYLLYRPGHYDIIYHK